MYILFISIYLFFSFFDVFLNVNWHHTKIGIAQAAQTYPCGDMCG